MNLVQWLATIGVSGLTAVTAVWVAGKYLADAWLKSRFDKALEAFRSEKARELEAFKFQGSRLLDRATKIHQREIEILPTLWDRMTAALSATANLTSRGQRVPKTEHMGDGQLKAYIAGLDLDDWEKQELLSLQGNERDDNLWLKLQWQRLRNAVALHGEFQNYVIANSVFLPADLRAELRRLSNLNYDALMEFDLALGDQVQLGPEAFKNRDLFAAQWQAGFETILQSVQGHLWVAGDAGTDLLAQRDRLIDDETQQQDS
jgi:hypothetical protein